MSTLAPNEDDNDASRPGILGPRPDGAPGKKEEPAKAPFSVPSASPPAANKPGEVAHGTQTFSRAAESMLPPPGPKSLLAPPQAPTASAAPAPSDKPSPVRDVSAVDAPDAADKAKRKGLPVNGQQTDPEGRLKVDLSAMQQQLQPPFQDADNSRPDAPAVQIGQASLPNRDARRDNTQPVFSLSPDPLSGNSPTDQYMQGKIDKSGLPPQIQNNADQMAALDDIRARFDPRYTVKGKVEQSAGSGTDPNYQLKEGSTSIERTNPAELDVNKPRVGSYVQSKFEIPGDLTYDGKPQTLHGYAKVTDSGSATAPVAADTDGQEFSFTQSQKRVFNQRDHEVFVTQQSGQGQSNQSTDSDQKAQTQSRETAVHVGGEISGQVGDPAKGVSASVGASYDQVDRQSNTRVQENTQRNLSSTDSTTHFGTVPVRAGGQLSQTESQPGILGQAGLQNVGVSMPSAALLDELLDDNSSPGNYIYDGNGRVNKPFRGYPDKFLRDDGNGLTFASEPVIEVAPLSSKGGNDVLVPVLYIGEKHTELGR